MKEDATRRCETHIRKQRGVGEGQQHHLLNGGNVRLEPANLIPANGPSAEIDWLHVPFECRTS